MVLSSQAHSPPTLPARSALSALSGLWTFSLLPACRLPRWATLAPGVSRILLQQRRRDSEVAPDSLQLVLYLLLYAVSRPCEWAPSFQLQPHADPGSVRLVSHYGDAPSLPQASPLPARKTNAARHPGKCSSGATTHLSPIATNFSRIKDVKVRRESNF